jgi:glutamine cyclotransferase
MKPGLRISLLLSLVIAVACSDSGVTPGRRAPSCEGPRDASGQAVAMDYTYRVINEYPHDTGALTQGLIWDDSMLVEGTGYSLGPSTLRRVELETGDVVQIRDMPDPTAFGEGVARVGDRIVQLTWVRNTAYVYDATTFDSVGVFTYPTQGWGLTHDGARFIMSDGTDTLYFRDFDTFDEIDRVNVVDAGAGVTGLNELEYIDGEVWANVYQQDVIVMIDPATGHVTGRLDLSGILSNPGGVLNGIAYDADSCRVFVTGKKWRRLFEIGLVPQ